MSDLDDKAEMITSRAYSLFPQCHKPCEYLPEGEIPFTMYSYERPSRIFWFCVSKELLARGLTEEEVVEWLQSKNPRWLLDSYEDRFEAMAKEMLNEFIN
jgi:hypothetical protein